MQYTTRIENRVTILGIPIDNVTRAEAVRRIGDMLSFPLQHHVMTPNNEMVVEAQSNEAFRRAAQSSSMNIADSTGIIWASRRAGNPLPERVTGVDTVEAVCKELSDEHSVFLLGGRNGVGERAAEALVKINPRLRVAGVYEGSPTPEDADDIVRRINESGAHMLLVAYGAPQQDLWIHQYLSLLPSVRMAMGVGGTFDFLAGDVARAPRWMQHMGLEWTWRFIQEPSRWKRMWNAVVVFPWLVFTKNGQPFGTAQDK